jgi:hypothetical protein
MGSLIDTKKLKEKAIEAIKKNKLIFIEDVCHYCAINKTTFYRHFPIEGNDYNDISNLLNENKISIKISIRKKWHDRQSDTGLMALYKLCSTPEEHKLLQQNYQDHTSAAPIKPDKIEIIMPARFKEMQEQKERERIEKLNSND